MIIMHNRLEHPCQDPFVVDYRRARTALILYLAASAGVCCHHYIHDTRPGAPDVITIVSSPKTIRDFTTIRDFLEGLQDNGLLAYLDDIEEYTLTADERSWLADYGMCQPTENERESSGIGGGER